MVKLPNEATIWPTILLSLGTVGQPPTSLPWDGIEIPLVPPASSDFSWTLAMHNKVMHDNCTPPVSEGQIYQ